jgi:hypothetical protein
MNNLSYPFADLALAQRLEKTEAHGNILFVEARAKASPESHAEWVEVAGTYAMFDGPTSPVSQTFCLGMFSAITTEDMEGLELFFKKRGAEVFHEVSPLADPSAPALLKERGYLPVEFSNVLFRPISTDVVISGSPNDKVKVNLTKENELQVWADTAFQGWSEYAEVSDFLRDMGKVQACSKSLSFLALLQDKPIATGMMSMCDGVALLAGASTVPEARRQGAQLALLEHRLRYGAQQGCDIAMMATLPGSASQRNAERHGFRIAYTRIKWQLMSRESSR